MKLGQFIKDFRASSGMSMDEFAKRAGLTKGYISQIENESNPRTGKAPVPSLVTLNGIAHTMGMNVDVLLGRVDDINVSLSGGDTLSRSDELRSIVNNLSDTNIEKLLEYARSLSDGQSR